MTDLSPSSHTAIFEAAVALRETPSLDLIADPSVTRLAQTIALTARNAEGGTRDQNLAELTVFLVQHPHFAQLGTGLAETVLRYACILDAALEMREFTGTCEFGGAHFVGQHRIDRMASMLVDCARSFEGDAPDNLSRIIRHFAFDESCLRAIGSMILGEVFGRARYVMEKEAPIASPFPQPMTALSIPKIWVH